MQIKIIMKYHTSHPLTAPPKEHKTTTVGKDVEKLVEFLHCKWGHTMMQLLWKTLGQSFKNWGENYHYNPAIPFLGHIPPKN